MILTETSLAGAYVIEPERREDERGFFARTWCQREFEAQGLDSRLVQCSVSFSRNGGTLRGMHFQLPPFAETKLVRGTVSRRFTVDAAVRVTGSNSWDHLNLPSSGCSVSAIWATTARWSDALPRSKVSAITKVIPERHA